jgi:magnesium transporter
MSDAALLPLIEPLIEADPKRAAMALEAMGDEGAAAAMLALTPQLAAAVLPHLAAGFAATLLAASSESTVSTVTAGLDPKRAASIIIHLPLEALERLVPHLPEAVRVEVQAQLAYPEDSVGRAMNTHFLAFHASMTAADAIRRIRALAQNGMPASYLYVVDDDDTLLGVLNMHSLMLAAEKAPLRTIMNPNIFSVHAFAERSQASEELSRRRYFAAPVVDSAGKIVGLIKAEHLLSDAKLDATEDLLRMVGAGSDERAFSPMRQSLKTRLPWLHVNLVTAFLAAGVVAMFEGLIAQLTVLAVFLPIIAGQGGNAGAQSLAIVMRGLVMREVPKDRRLKLIAKEATIGIITGAATGAVTGFVAWLVYGNPTLGFVVTIAMIVNLFFAGAAGASIPLLLKALRLDPAQSSSIILTTVTDIVGFFVFLSLALAFKDAIAA